jgi:hypothetical protein
MLPVGSRGHKNPINVLNTDIWCSFSFGVWAVWDQQWWLLEGDQEWPNILCLYCKLLVGLLLSILLLSVLSECKSILMVWNTYRLMAVSAQMGSKAMESINVKVRANDWSSFVYHWRHVSFISCWTADVNILRQMLMNARKGPHANARNATARTHGEAMSVAAVEACCTWRSMIHA